MAPTLLFAGLGNMGRAMSKNLVEKGNLSGPLLVYNRSTKRATDLSAALAPGKTKVVESLPEGVADADIIFSCLANDQAVQDYIGQAAKGDIKGKLFVECSTIHPDVTEEVARTILAAGAEFVAAPVFGAPSAADAGQLIILLAGPAASVEKVRPYCKGVMGKAEIDLSDQPYGKATTIKVLGNGMILGMVEQVAEAHVAAEKSGIHHDIIHNLIQGLFGGPGGAYSDRMRTGDYYTRDEPLFGVDLARKDARHAKSIAAAAGTTLPICEIADGHLAKVKEYCGSKGDIAGIYGIVRMEAGLPFKN
ncbi:Pyrroline-5-carboxylate reductase [Geosmithia morbida]|uniref:Pyrroline-5-carboxylate reductase n=1 Tax=Geosmithia morbida TaxID=1094350 RepID=A0A9P4Z0R6_9HYPO|nr:Pyrroline-5-carboxylate reductase [Geosmithia morbida]KAF4125302.1 Pyrroline-5-carboxylate reductase [Geosmithia morbida]